jgi:hypothetical protein
METYAYNARDRTPLEISAQNRSLAVTVGMREKPVTRLFGWKKIVLLLVCCIAGVLYQTRESYQRKGHLDSVDIWVAALAIAVSLGIVGLVVWWGNREE